MSIDTSCSASARVSPEDLSRAAASASGALAENAKAALERVCSGAALDSFDRYYSASFVDHVNDLEFHGLPGAERSVAMYRRMLDDLSIRVEEQVVSGDRVVSRFVVSGTSQGRSVRFNGITISRFRDGLIVEDWSVTDTLGMLRQLGLLRSLRLVGRYLAAEAAQRTAERRSPEDQAEPT